MNTRAAKGKAMEVLTTSKKLVKPSTATPSHRVKHKLCCYDQAQPHVYVALIFHYHADDGGRQTAPERIRRLEESLSQTLTLFNHMAGRYGAEDDGCAIDCNDQGVEVVEANVNRKLDELLLDEEEHCSESLLALPGRPAAVPGSSPPMVAVKINVFECGGLALGVQMYHVAGDMWSMSTFINAWATASRQGITDVVRPSFDLGSLLPPRDQELAKVPEIVDEVVTLGKHKLTMKTFVLSEEALSRLRADVTTVVSPDHQASARNNRPSRVVLATALISRALMRADRAKCGQSRPIAISHAISLRGRTKLDVSENIFGNFLDIVIAQPPLETGEENEQDSLRALVGCVGDALREAIAEFGRAKSNEDLRMRMEDSRKQINELLLKGETNIIAFSSWCRFPFYGADYGWGCPSMVSTSKAIYPNMILLMETKGRDGIQAWVTLEDKDIEHFERDPGILTYAK